MAPADNQLEGELWQVLTHAFANSLFAIGLVMFLAGAFAFAFLPHRKIWLAVAAIGAALAGVALALHLVAWF